MLPQPDAPPSRSGVARRATVRACHWATSPRATTRAAAGTGPPPPATTPPPLGDDPYSLSITAATRKRVGAPLAPRAARFDVRIADESDATTLLALQGEQAQAMLQPLTDLDLETIGYYRFAEATLDGAKGMISRTGYTGEDGFELYLPNAAAVDIWRALLSRGAAPIGLAARDMLRTEMGYALYGHEINDAVTPVEAGLMWITRLDKGDFIGRDAVAARKGEGKKKALVGLRLTGRGIPREHYPVVSDGRVVGEVTSGLFSPLAGAGVALAYVEPRLANEGELAVDIRGKPVAAERTKPPFVRSRVRR